MRKITCNFVGEAHLWEAFFDFIQEAYPTGEADIDLDACDADQQQVVFYGNNPHIFQSWFNATAEEYEFELDNIDVIDIDDAEWARIQERIA